MSEELIECPFCAEEIKAAAIKCKHCGSMLEKQSGAGKHHEEKLPGGPPERDELDRGVGWVCVVAGALGALWIGTQVKSLLGVRYVGDMPEAVTKISDGMYFVFWASAVGAIALGITIINQNR